MSLDPKHIAKELSDGTDLAAAALLCALVEDGDVDIPKEDAQLLRVLTRYGLVTGKTPTALGRKVALHLLATGEVGDG